jgi:hypothetical protein
MMIQAKPPLAHSPAVVGSPDAYNFDSVKAVSRDLTFCRCEPAVHDIKQFERESLKEQGVCTAMLACISEHFQRKAQSMAHCTPTVLRT